MILDLFIGKILRNPKALPSHLKEYLFADCSRQNLRVTYHDLLANEKEPSILAVRADR